MKLKKLLAVILSVLILSGMVPLDVWNNITFPDLSLRTEAATDGLVYGDGEGITRAEWLYDLSLIFEMSAEDTPAPDNYFSDLEETHEYYNEIILAVDLGVVDIAAGEALYPDEYATRDFAVSTLNFCLGYQLDDTAEYTFLDSVECTDPASAQIALDRGWVEAVEGNFSPEALVTEDEAEVMLTDAEAVLAAAVVDQSYESTYEFEDGVIVIPDGTEAYEDENGVVTITDCPQNLSAGDRFAVYYSGIPVVYTADSVSVSGNNTVITTTQLETSDGLTEVDAQGIVGSEDIVITPMEGVELEVEEEEQSVSTYGLARISDSIKTKNLKVSKKLNLGEGISVSINVKIINPTIEYSINSSSASVVLKGDAEISVNAEMDLAEMTGFNEVDLLYCGIPGVGGFSVSVKFELKGSANTTVKGRLVTGIECPKYGGMRLIKSFRKSDSYSVVEGSVKVGLLAKLGVTKLPVINAYAYGEVGVEAKAANTTYGDDALPRSCVHYAAYLYANFGVTGKVEFGVWEDSVEYECVVYDEDNSPWRVVHHYEDGTEVASCTRGNTYFNFFTLGSSRWGGSGWIGGNGAYGLNADGTPFVLYNYTLNDNSEATITKYNGNSNYVSIPETIDGYTVVAIGDKAFAYKDITTVIIPDTVVEIKSAAFVMCKRLSSVTLSKSVKKMGAYAFGYCDSLTVIEIPKSLEETNDAYYYEFVYGYQHGVFRGCKNLRTVTFESGITQIANGLFTACDGLRSITIPDTVTTIENRAFADCGNLETVVFSNSLTTIESDAFRYTALREVQLPDSITSIGSAAFVKCRQLSEVKLPKSLKKMGAYAFGYCDSLTAIEIPKSLEETTDAYYNEFIYGYQHGVFIGSNNLKTVTFESGATEVANGLFANNEGLETVSIPDTVTKIENFAFGRCKNLKTVTLSNSLISIGSAAFRGTAIEKIIIPDSLTSIPDGVFADCEKLSDVTLSKNLKSMGAFAFAKCTALESITIPKTLETTTDAYYYEYISGYDYGVFFGCENLKNVTLEDGIKLIPRGLFSNNNGLEKIEMPESVTKVDYKAFRNCTNLKEVIFSENITQIIAEAFRNTSIKTIALPEGLTIMEHSIFADCANLEAIVIPDSVTTMGTHNFLNCTALKTAILSKSLTELTASNFENCSQLSKIEIPEKIERINSNAFKGCTALETVTFAENSVLDFLGNEAFRNCDALKTIALPDTLKSTQDSVFMDCENLSEITIPDYTLTSLNTNFFANCPSIEKIILPKGLTAIGSQAFMNCTGLTEVTIPQSVTSIDSTAFSYPAKTTIYGVAGSYAETFAVDGGFTFVDISAPCDGFALSDFAEYIVLERGETYRAEFITDPEPTTDIITLASSNSKVTISGMDIYASSAGDAVITATTSGGLTYEFTVHVRAVSNIAVTASPTKTEYIIGETLDVSGMTVTVNYGDGTSKEVTDYTVSGFDSSAEGECTVTVKWVSANNTSYTATFTVNVTDPAPKLTGIYVAELPFRIRYAMRTALDTTGLVIMGTYSDGIDRVITDYTTTKINTLKAGEQTITVTSGEFTCSFTVTVINCTSHTSGDWEIMTAPAADTSGVRVKRCTVCQTVLETETFSGNKTGDIDGDGIIGASDIALMRKALLSGSGDAALYDINGDGAVTVIDLIQLKKLAAEIICGDTDGSGDIDSEDVAALRRVLLTSDTEYNKAYDTNGDGVVTIADLIRLKRYLAGEAVTIG